MKCGRAADLNGCIVLCLKSDGASVIKWLVRLLNIRFVISMILIDWASACVIPLYKIKAIGVSVLNLGRESAFEVVRIN